MKPNADLIRQKKGRDIAFSARNVKRLSETKYKVKSQSFDGFYTVENTEIGWKCDCPDHKWRGMICKHIWAVKISQRMREQVVEAKPKRVLEPISVVCCPECGSISSRKDGVRHNKSGDLQKYKCLDCGKFFSINVGFEKMKNSPHAITTAMQLYFSGESLRNAMKSLKYVGVNVSHMTVNRWIEKYTGIMKTYADNIKPDVGQTWRADEIWIKFKGDMKYLFALIDDETRYWIAQEVADTKHTHDARHLFKMGGEITGKRPETLITDGLQSYKDAFNKEFYTNSKPQSQHINAIKLTGKANNNKMERINGEIRDREKTMRGLKIKHRFSSAVYVPPKNPQFCIKT